MAYIVKERIWQRANYTPHAKQQLVHSRTERFRTVAWGRRAGKSQTGGMELVPAAYLAYAQRNMLEDIGKRHEYWIVGPEYSDSEKEFRVVYNALKRLEMPFDRPGTYNNPQGGDMHISLWGGRFLISAMSAKYPDTLVGEGLKGLVLSEAAKLKRLVWEKHLRATLADWKGWCYLGSTPEGKNWFWELYMAGLNPNMPEYWSMRAPSWINPHVYPGRTEESAVKAVQAALASNTFHLGMPELAFIDPEVLSLMQGMSDELFNQEIAALFTEFTGRVFKEFDEEVHVVPQVYNPSLPTFAAVDYGYTNPNVWLVVQVEKWGRVRVLSEYYERGKTAQEMAREIRQRGLHHHVSRFYPDPASPGDSATLSKELGIPSAGGTGGELNDRLELIRQALKLQNTHIEQPLDKDRLPNLLIDPSCHNTIADMLNYRYPESRSDQLNTSELPMKKDDHAPEALGRFMRGYFGAPKLRRKGARVRKANVRG
jgi:hypothetical protein